MAFGLGGGWLAAWVGPRLVTRSPWGIYDGSVHLEVEDDGVGRVKSHELEKAMKADHRSMATEITRERLRILNRKLKQKIRFGITDLVDQGGASIGTKVSIVLPVEVG